MFKSIKKSIKKYLEDLAKENKELYGGKRIDCCDLNRAQNNTVKK